MKCTNKKSIRALWAMAASLSLILGGCGKTEALTDAYRAYDADFLSGTEASAGAGAMSTYTGEQAIAVTPDENFGTDQTSSSVAEGAGVFNLATREVTYSQNLFERLYPASTTKIMTAYLILQGGNLSDEVTVSAEAVDVGADSSTCDLAAGDVLTVADLLHGLMLVSGNDAANALAEYLSGSVDAFVAQMNETAQTFGATNTHFTNPHGLPDEEHYTTVYDMYLIFGRAIRNEDFVKLISTASYEASYRNAAGESVSRTWNSTDQYLSGGVTPPEGVTVIGGKTGTTRAAGYCLVLYSLNAKNEGIISIVFKSDGRSDLYLLMNELLEKFTQ